MILLNLKVCEKIVRYWYVNNQIGEEYICSPFNLVFK